MEYNIAQLKQGNISLDQYRASQSELKYASQKANNKFKMLVALYKIERGMK